MSIAKLLVLVFVIHVGNAGDDPILKCKVCEFLMKELEKGIAAVDPNKMIEIRGRVEADGSRSVLKKQYRRSELYLGELLGEICEKMEDYIHGFWRKSGRKDVLPRLVDGEMNPQLFEFAMVEDSGLEVMSYCETILDEQEEELMAFLSKEREEDISQRFCYLGSGMCPEHVPTKEEL